jgi:hypothetical protein
VHEYTRSVCVLNNIHRSDTGEVIVERRERPVYEGFCFRTRSEPFDTLVSSPKEAGYTFQQYRDRLTIPTEELSAELATLFARS